MGANQTVHTVPPSPQADSSDNSLVKLQDPAERQVAPTLDGIRADHVERYRWAARCIANEFSMFGPSIVDLGCGVGYGAHMLATLLDAPVMAIDRDPVAISYGRQHFDHPKITWAPMDLRDLRVWPFPRADVAVAFEVIEHLEDPKPVLRALAHIGVSMLLLSVPNEDVIPWSGAARYHFRHYEPGQLQSLIEATGWCFKGPFFGQMGIDSPVRANTENGRTLCALCTLQAAV